MVVLIYFRVLAVMLVSFIKFIHILSILGLIGLMFYSKAHRILLILCGIALITGTLLVYPKHFTFHTPWIKAAYTLLFVFIFSLWALRKSKINNSFVNIGAYSFLIALLVLTIHDAVTKSTILF